MGRVLARVQRTWDRVYSVMGLILNAGIDFIAPMVPRPRPLYLQLRGAMDSVSTSNLGVAGSNPSELSSISWCVCSTASRTRVDGTFPRRSWCCTRRRRGRTRRGLEEATGAARAYESGDAIDDRGRAHATGLVLKPYEAFNGNGGDIADQIHGDVTPDS